MLNGRDLVLDHDMDRALSWVDSTQCWVTILLNGRHQVSNHDVDQSSTGRLNLVLSSHSLGEWRHLVCYQEGTISPRLGLRMCDTLTLDQWACGLLQGLAWLRYPSTWSWCHTECEIKALEILSVHDDVLRVVMRDHLEHMWWPHGHLKKAKAKVINTWRPLAPLRCKSENAKRPLVPLKVNVKKIKE